MTRILRIVHVDDLHTILRFGGIWAPGHRPAHLPVASSIAHVGIVDRRAQRPVPVGPGGPLHDYVPFYLGERSPMLLANHKGKVASNPYGQAVIVYLEAFAEEVQDGGHGFVFTDGHAAMAVTRFFDDLRDLATLDWATIRARSWADTANDPDRKRRKQAEFLVWRFFPWALVRRVVVFDAAIQARVQSLLANAGVSIPVDIQRDWYY